MGDNVDKQYKNPPIKELVCEFRVSERDSWDLTTFGRLYEAFKDNFPNKKSFTNRSIGVSSDKNELIQNVSIEERILFSSEKREKLIGIGKNLFYFSFLPPYPGWRNAKKQLESLLKTFKEIIGDKKYVRLGFRLLNQITVPNIGKINEYLNFSVNWPKELNSVPKEISALSLFEYNKSKCIVRIYNERNKHPSNSFIFDMDYYLINKDGISSNEALKWFDEAHKNTKAIFEASIKDKLREKFEEAKENENNNFTK